MDPSILGLVNPMGSSIHLLWVFPFSSSYVCAQKGMYIFNKAAYCSGSFWLAGIFLLCIYRRDLLVFWNRAQAYCTGNGETAAAKKIAPWLRPHPLKIQLGTIRCTIYAINGGKFSSVLAPRLFPCSLCREQMMIFPYVVCGDTRHCVNPESARVIHMICFICRILSPNRDFIRKRPRIRRRAFRDRCQSGQTLVTVQVRPVSAIKTGTNNVCAESLARKPWKGHLRKIGLQRGFVHIK